jgi:hypothetical protein
MFSRVPTALAAARGRRALTKACRIAGGQNALAREIGHSQSTVWSWLQSGLVGDVEAIVAIERVTGVSRHKLRPDLSAIFGPPNQGTKHGTNLAGRLAPSA